MKKLSLRLRLIVFFVTVSCIIWLVAGFASWKETREKIDEFFDTYQIALARQLATADWKNIASESQHITNQSVKNIHNADDEDEAIGFAVFDMSGKMIFHDNENGKHFNFLDAAGVFINQKIDDEDEWRIIRLKSTDGKYLIAVGQELEYRDEIAWDMAEEFMLPWAFGLVFLLLFIVVLMTVEFKPLNKLAQDLDGRDGNDLSPLAEEKIPQEIKPLIKAMNHMLKQIEHMMKRERSFVADSAHELRTPLTALKVQLEVAQLAADDEKTRTEALQKLEQGIERSARLVEQLLALSRIESFSSASSFKDEKINWEQISAAVFDEYKQAAKAKGIKLESDIAGEGPVEQGNPVLCSLLLRNLIDNAVKYSPENAVVLLNIRGKKMEVINSDTVVDEKIMEHLSERFFRPSGQKESGSGLGLSIVESIVSLYGCKVVFNNTESGFQVVVVSE